MTIDQDIVALMTEMVASELGIEAVWNGAMRVNGIYDDAQPEPFGVETAGPSFTCMSDDITGVAHGDTLDLIDGTRYLVRGIADDGTGITLLTIEKQP